MTAFTDLETRFPRWHLWKSSVGLLYARRLNTSPARIVRAENLADLSRQMEAHEDDCWRVSEKSAEVVTGLPLRSRPKKPHELRDGGHSYWYDRP